LNLPSILLRTITHEAVPGDEYARWGKCEKTTVSQKNMRGYADAPCGEDNF